MAQKKKSGKTKKREKVSKVIEQISEPFSLLNTLKQEGLSNLMSLATMAGGVASQAGKNFDLLKPAVREIVMSFGFAYKDDLERLEARIEELEDKLSEFELQKIQTGFDEE